MIGKLVSYKTEAGEDLPTEKKLWIVRTIAGAVTADDVVHQNEKIHIERLFDELQEDPEALITLRESMRRTQPPEIPPMDLPHRLAEQVLRQVMEICACDHELVPEEIRYINEVGMALGLNVLRVHKLVHSMVRHVKIEFFNQLINRLDISQRRWLATLVMKSIYADGRVDKGEIIYFNDVYELLDGDQSLIDSIKRESKSLKLEELPQMQFDNETATQVLRYLVEITLSDEDIDDRELNVVHTTARLLDYDEVALQQLIRSVYLVRIFMLASAELIRG